MAATTVSGAQYASFHVRFCPTRISLLEEEGGKWSACMLLTPFPTNFGTSEIGRHTCQSKTQSISADLVSVVERGSWKTIALGLQSYRGKEAR